MYILIAILGYAALAAVNLFDKLLVSQPGAKQHPLVVAFYSTTPLLALGVLIILTGTTLKLATLDWVLALVSGFAFVGALITMYKSLTLSAVSYNGPLVGAVTTLITVGAAAWLLSENLSIYQLSGVALLVLGSIITTKKHSQGHHWQEGLFYAIMAGAFFSISNIFVKPLYNHIGFFPGLLWSRFFMGAVGALLILHPVVRKQLQKKKSAHTNIAPKHFWVIFLTDKGLGMFGDILVQYAIALGSVSIVTALAGTQYAILLALVVMLSHFIPRFYHEDFKKRGITGELLGIALIVLGFILVV